MSDITVVVPSIPPRRGKLLSRALGSVNAQTLTPAQVIVSFDHDRVGPAEMRNRMMRQVTTEYVAFLDDDDELRPEHLRVLRTAARETDADVIYPWFDVKATSGRGWDPLGEFGKPFDGELLRNVKNYIPVTLLARVDVLLKAGGFQNRAEPPATTCEDWGCWLNVLDAGGTFHHVPKRTWIWHWHGKNTSGRNDVW